MAPVAAENLFLRKQLGLFVERKVKPRRATDSIRFTLARLSRWFDWRAALIVVKPDTFLCGRPHVPANVRKLIREMSPKQSWGEELVVVSAVSFTFLNRKTAFGKNRAQSAHLVIRQAQVDGQVV
jgi:hypothetical protein